MTLVRLKFTDASLRALKAPEQGQTDYADSLTVGLYIRVGQRTKTFTFRRIVGTRRERITIGQYPDVSLAKAREEARRYRAEKTLGLVSPKPRSSFPECLEEFLTIKRQVNRPRTMKFTERLLRKYFPFTGDVTEIDAKALAKNLDAIKAPSERAHAYAEARTFFNWLARQRRIPFSPMVGLDTPRKTEGRDRVLTDEEMVSVWLSVPQEVYGDIIRLAILTAQRIGQINALRGEYIQHQAITWPASAMKANKRHTIPVTTAVAEIVAAYPRIGFLFPSQAGQPFYIRVRHKNALDKASGVSNFTHHDLRRSVATKMAELGVQPHVIERLLAHAGAISGVAAIYNRASYIPEMEAALLLWQSRLDQLVRLRLETEKAA